MNQARDLTPADSRRQHDGLDPADRNPEPRAAHGGDEPAEDPIFAAPPPPPFPRVFPGL